MLTEAVAGSILLAGSIAFIGRAKAAAASAAIPDPDLRQRPTSPAVESACLTLGIELPMSDAEIKAAARALYPRCPGDHFPDGTLRIHRLDEVMLACEILLEANAYDADPPYEARHLLGYWRYRAGLAGRLWAWLRPPPEVQRLRLQSIHEA